MVERDEHPGESLVFLAAILCGGRARRMGTDKVALPLGGTPLVERVWQRVAALVDTVVAVGGRPDVEHLGMAVVPDRYPGADSMGGIATALAYAAERFGDTWVLALACDLPFLEPRLIQHLARLSEGYDVVVPRVSAGYEPLCALYRTTCLPVFEECIRNGQLAIRSIFSRVRTREVPETELRRFDPALHSFINLNRPADLECAHRLLGVKRAP
ncbi:MAG: molybdenum cofactor guanylyltransferase [Deferrisomatales bacterium]|nr:molybdenum cofactor guanylyltransferase [Deferrisomatales bacterium]